MQRQARGTGQPPEEKRVGTNEAGDALSDPDKLAEDALRYRRRRFIEHLAAIGIPFLFVLLPVALLPTFHPVTLVAMSFGLASICIGVWLTRSDHVEAAAIVLIAGSFTSVTAEMVGMAVSNGGLDISQLRTLDLYLVPVVLGAVVMRRSGSLVTTALCSVAVASELLFLPQSVTIREYLANTYPYSNGTIYDLLAVPLALQWLTTGLIGIAASGVHRSLRRAYQADALAEANRQIVERSRQLANQRQVLQQGIHEIQTVYAMVQRGDTSARVKAANPETMLLALNFNLLLDRLARLSSENVFYRRMYLSQHARQEPLVAPQPSASGPLGPGPIYILPDNAGSGQFGEYH